MRASLTRLIFAASLTVGPALAAQALSAEMPQKAATPVVVVTEKLAPIPWTENGEATWYGPRHAGLRTTSGEIFNPNKMTAAHPSLPLGSWVRVTLAQNGRSVVVRVNDREPPHGVRCIDLSHEAARRLGIVSQGVADVTLTQLTGAEAVEVAEAPEAPKHRRHR